MKRTTVFKDMFLHAYAIFILPRVSNRCKPMSGNSIDQSMKLVNWYRLVSANHKNRSSIAIDWLSNLEQTSRTLSIRSSAIFRRP